jgi:isopenicillin-N epimerase
MGSVFVAKGKLFGYLWDKRRIVTSPTKHAQFEGVRVTPNVYTTLDEVDLFVDAMKKALAKGV